VQTSLEIARALLRPRAVRAASALALAAGAIAGGLPLLETPGYELGQALALLAALLGPAAGIAAARRARAHEAPSPLGATLGASLALAVPLGLAAAGVLARAALGPCAALSRATWFVPLLAVPSVLLATALAVAATFVARGRRVAAAGLYAAAAAGSLAWTLRGAYLGPAAFAFDPLLGGWPGPLYDEALAPDARAVLFRCAAAAAAVAVAAGAEAAVRLRRSGLRAAAGPIAAALAAAAAVAGAHAALEALSLSGSRAAVTRALGGRRDGPRCTLVLPSEKPAAAADALLADCEFQVADVAAALGIPPPSRVTVFVHRSAAEKRRLVGAAATEFAKPWLREVHVVDAPLPHPVLRHELVHAVGAEIARGLLGVPSRGVFFSAGLVEGLAAALETPRGAWTVHEWSRAARDLGLLPDVAAIVGAPGFYGEAPARSYTAAGSFLAFLLERRGAAPVREAYRTGDLARAFGVPLRTLAGEWHAFLDGIEPAPGLLAAARARLGRGSLFARPCAREVALLEVRAAQAAATGRAPDACAAFEAAATRSGSARDLLAAGEVRARAGDLEGAERSVRAAARAAGDDAALGTALATTEGDLAWRRGEPAEAIARWSAALGAHPDRAEERLLEAKIVAARDPSLSEAARPLLLGDGDPAAALARVALVPHPLAAYLVGRALATRGEAAAAVPPLERAAAGGLPGALRREATLLLAQARCASGAREAGEASLRELGGDGASAADRARAGEALRRCEAAR
jgi:hypothetical protein